MTFDIAAWWWIEAAGGGEKLTYTVTGGRCRSAVSVSWGRQGSVYRHRYTAGKHEQPAGRLRRDLTDAFLDAALLLRLALAAAFALSPALDLGGYRRSVLTTFCWLQSYSRLLIVLLCSVVCSSAFDNSSHLSE